MCTASGLTSASVTFWPGIKSEEVSFIGKYGEQRVQKDDASIYSAQAWLENWILLYFILLLCLIYAQDRLQGAELETYSIIIIYVQASRIDNQCISV